MNFERDEAKRQITLKERGLDFADLERFDWETAMVSKDFRHDYGETRTIAFGCIDDRLLCLAYTMSPHALRVISLRKANSRERKVYEHFISQATD